jgi:hypothetical protein
MTGGLSGTSLPLEGTTIGVVSKLGQSGQIPIGQPFSNGTRRRSRRSFPTANWRGTMRGATRLPRMSEGGTRLKGAGRNADDPNLWTPPPWTPRPWTLPPWTPLPWPLPPPKAGDMAPAPKKPNMTIAGSQKIRSLMARSMGHDPLGTIPCWSSARDNTATPMRRDSAKNTPALSIAAASFPCRDHPHVRTRFAERLAGEGDKDGEHARDRAVHDLDPAHSRRTLSVAKWVNTGRPNRTVAPSAPNTL